MGAAHFEMIISFVFFAGFVFFLFVILSPGGGSKISGAVVSGLYDSFEEEVYTNLSEVFLSAEYSGSGDCFYVELPGRIFAYDLGSGNSYVTNLGGVDVDSGLVDGVPDDDLNLDIGDSAFRVAVSPEFSDEGIGGCEVLDNYSLGSIKERRVISYDALVNMVNRYYVEYDVVKRELGVPDILDFAIVPDTLDDVVMGPQNGVPGSIDVDSRDYVVEVLYANGTVVNDRFSLLVW